MTWLVTGGAGYIGSHVVRDLMAAGMPAVVLDDLSSGRRDRLPERVPLVEASVLDTAAVTAGLRSHAVRGVIHLAGKKSVPESVERPLHYYEQNVCGFASLLTAMAAAGVDRMVFSSSASVFGTPSVELVDEDTPTHPESPYGHTKLACEWMLADAAATRRMHWACLRYFNVVGAGAAELGDTSELNLIPLTFRALESGRAPQVFGGDYPTRDGSCIRDYVHVVDLARAHVAALQRLEEAPEEPGAAYGRVLNVGRGVGVTVKEVMAVVAQVTGRPFRYEVIGRRPGDPAHIVGAVDRIAVELDWKAELDLHDMVRSAWEARGSARR